MAVSFDRDQIVVPRGVVAREVDRHLVLLNSNTGRYFTLDDVGTRAWARLTSSSSIQRACDALMNEYSVGPEQLRQDLEALIDQLSGLGLVEIRRGG